MSRLLLIPLLLLALLTPLGLGQRLRTGCDAEAPACDCCSVCCEECPCCMSGDDQTPPRPPPARVVEGPRVDWAPAPERELLALPNRHDRGSRAAALTAVLAAEHVRLHARIGVWLN